MRTNPVFKVVSVVTALAFASIACGLGGGDSPEPTREPRTTQEQDNPDPTPEDNGNSGGDVISSWRDAENATIQILAEGTFIDPAEGFQANAVGSGSGFIIDPSGIAVTNNHVVTGAARIVVYLNGEEYRARVLGASECNDLAVIQIDSDRDLPYFEVYRGDVEVGMQVYSAGFPLGDPEFTLTRGIISKANADGDSNWASVDSVVEHDARINGGNSGGPLVNEDGLVVGVNYAGNVRTDQNFAIVLQDTMDVIDDLRSGIDVDSIGINGQAVTSEDGSISGIWVSSVKSGSPADRTGITGGDIILTMEGVSLGRGGSMRDYCDVIRSHDTDAVLSVEVLRFGSNQLLSGQLNGRELEVTAEFDGDNSGGTTEDPNNGGTTSDFVTLTDDYGAISIDVPSEWSWYYPQPLDLDRNGQDDTSSLLFGPTEETNYSVSWIWIWFSKRGNQTGTGAYEWVLDYVQLSDYGREIVGDPAWGAASDYCDGPQEIDPFNLDGFDGRAEYYTGCAGSHLLYVNAQRARTNLDYTLAVIANVADEAEVEFLVNVINTMVLDVNALP